MNSNPQLLRTLYTSASARYYKLKNRYDKRIQNKTFQQLTRRKQFALLNQLKKLYERLKSLHTLLRVAAAGSVIALTLSTTDVKAQTLGPFSRNDAANPLPPPYTIAVPRPAAIDIDKDGDLDVFVGDKYGNIQFFRNTADKTHIKRLVKDDENNPFASVNAERRAVIAFADVDGDSDFDALIGNSYGYTYFFRNTGTATNPVFTQQTGSNNPFDGFTGSFSPKYGRREAIPTFADIDGDSDIDLVIGSRYIHDSVNGNVPSIHVFKNNAGVFTASDNSAFSALFSITEAALAFVNLDGDADVDILVGNRYGNIRAFLNNGTSFIEQYGAWNPTTRTGNPAYDFYLSQNSAPYFADFDGDGDLDLIVGAGSNYSTALGTRPIGFFENTDNKFTFEQRNGLNNAPFEGVDVGSDATPAFVDLDNDGDLDAVLGNKYNYNLNVFINENGEYTYDADHPFSELEIAFGTKPVFVDIDNDGDQDLFVSTSNDEVFFFYNNAGTFAQIPSPLNPTASGLSIAFIDIDNDGDFDALISSASEQGIELYRNTGTAENAAFSKATPPAPFNSLDFKYYATITSVDFDHDGDTDIIISETVYDDFMYTAFRFFENTDGDFAELASSTFDAITSAGDYINFADADGDGDLDIFVGHGSDHNVGEDGRVSYFENQNPAPVTNVSQSSVSVTLNTPVILDPDLTITDDDGDNIILATVTISNFHDGNEALDFTPSLGITGDFEDGVLTIRGKATIADYEDILRTVTYEVTGNVTSSREAGRAAGVPPQGKTVTFSVRDTDFTETIVSVVSVIALDIIGEPDAKIVVYNAVSPGVSTGLNDFMRITGLPAENKVSIFNRWGDKVFEISRYDNNARRFEGKNDNGKDLPSGTYYYLIETGKDKVSGYLSLKR